MTKLLITSFALLAGSTAFASDFNSMPDSRAMTCAQARGAVRSQGAIVLRTGTHTYDRYVAHGGFCSSGDRTSPAWVPTRDKAQCFVGYTCESDAGNGGFGE